MARLQPVRSTSWRRVDRDSTNGAGSFRSSRLRARESKFRSNLSSTPDIHSSGAASSSSPASRDSSSANLEPISKRARRSVIARVAAGAQTSLTLDSTLVASSFANNGQVAGSASSTPSLTSTNNFINFCATAAVGLTDGQQLLAGSCNPAPMGLIPSIDHIPTVRISQPQNGMTVAVNTTIPLTLLVSNLESGIWVDFTSNFLSAPQQLGASGNVLGHYQVVIEELEALNSTIPTDSSKFAFFSILEDVADSKNTTTTAVTGGLPEGFYRLTATPHAANYQPVLAPIQQHGALNDVVYFTVTADGTPGSAPAIKRRIPVPRAQHLYPPSPRREAIVPRASSDAQSSLTLLPSVIAPGFANAEGVSRAGQAASLTSVNNYINFCGTTTLPLNNGTQTRTGFCNPAPMGAIPASTRMPSSKFTYPRNGDILSPNSPMVVGLAVTNLATGNFANEEVTYMTAPQQLDSSGQILGHPFIVVEAVTSLSSATTVLNPILFTFFKGITGVADSTGVLTTIIDSGFPVGHYRLSSIVTTTNGQPVLLPVLNHGAVDDAIYFTVAKGGALPTNQTGIVGLPSKSSSTSATGAPSQTGPSTHSSTTPVKARINVAAAVGGALAGIALIALGIFVAWFLIRRRTRANLRAKQFDGQIVLNNDDFGPAPVTPFNLGLPPAHAGSSSSMVQISSPPTAFNASKASRGLADTRRSSVMSAAPSYHTQISRP
ncbi:hypothetical protein B0H16DRAFT_1522018 [Mycena metata]|uniref:Uncharacterized protein n=1 Tax=Mycena metata TaxID=1033252 RepID=A0AAD7JP88_9AGAR|nr:hypothetical protein B0H16DRAFT_1522018 [Mycena metata]